MLPYTFLPTKTWGTWGEIQKCSAKGNVLLRVTSASLRDLLYLHSHTAATHLHSHIAERPFQTCHDKPYDLCWEHTAHAVIVEIRQWQSDLVWRRVTEGWPQANMSQLVLASYHIHKHALVWLVWFKWRCWLFTSTGGFGSGPELNGSKAIGWDFALTESISRTCT